MNEIELKKRKKLEHYNIPYHAHELTFTCYHRTQYLKNRVLCDLFVEVLTGTCGVQKPFIIQ